MLEDLKENHLLPLLRNALPRLERLDDTGLFFVPRIAYASSDKEAARRFFSRALLEKSYWYEAGLLSITLEEWDTVFNLSARLVDEGGSLDIYRAGTLASALPELALATSQIQNFEEMNQFGPALNISTRICHHEASERLLLRLCNDEIKCPTPAALFEATASIIKATPRFPQYAMTIAKNIQSLADTLAFASSTVCLGLAGEIAAASGQSDYASAAFQTCRARGLYAQAGRIAARLGYITDTRAVIEELYQHSIYDGEDPPIPEISDILCPLLTVNPTRVTDVWRWVVDLCGPTQLENVEHLAIFLLFEHEEQLIGKQ